MLSNVNISLCWRSTGITHKISAPAYSEEYTVGFSKPIWHQPKSAFQNSFVTKPVVQNTSCCLNSFIITIALSRLKQIASSSRINLVTYSESQEIQFLLKYSESSEKLQSCLKQAGQISQVRHWRMNQSPEIFLTVKREKWALLAGKSPQMPIFSWDKSSAEVACFSPLTKKPQTWEYKLHSSHF